MFVSLQSMYPSAVSALLAGLHFWWPKIIGRMYAERPARIAALAMFPGFNVTVLPQYLMGYLRLPRRCYA